MTHAFFANMGGFVLQAQLSPTLEESFMTFPLDSNQVLYRVQSGYVPYSAIAIEKQEILDKDKVDGVVRLLLVCQIFWYLVCCVGRLVQHLDVTVLEVATVGSPLWASSFAVWERISSGERNQWMSTEIHPTTQLIIRRDSLRGWRTRKPTLQADTNGLCGTRRVVLDKILGVLEGNFEKNGIQNRRAGEAHRKYTKRRLSPHCWKPHVGSLRVSNGIWCCSSHGLGLALSHRCREEVMAYRDGHDHDMHNTDLGHGGLCMADSLETRKNRQWLHRRKGTTPSAQIAHNAPTPSPLPSSSCAIKLGRGDATGINLKRVAARLRNNTTPHDPVMDVPLRTLVPVTLYGGIYLIVRGYVIIEGIINLRALPPSAYESVNWSAFLPHF